MTQERKIYLIIIPNSGSKIWEGQQETAIRYCDLPRNSKVAINLKLITKEGISLIIGCVSFNVFNHDGILKNKHKGLNIWPFYKYDPKLGWMKEYGAVSSKIFKILNKMRKKCHSKLFIAFDSFSEKVIHSIRNIEGIGDEHAIVNNIDFDNTLVRLKNLSFSEKDIMFRETLNWDNITESEKLLMMELVKKNPIGLLDRSTKEVLFKWRRKYSKISKALPLFLKSIGKLISIQVCNDYNF